MFKRLFGTVTTNICLVFYSEVHRQLQYDEDILVNMETDAENGTTPPQPRERLLVKLPVPKGKSKGKKKTGEPPRPKLKVVV